MCNRDGRKKRWPCVQLAASSRFRRWKRLHGRLLYACDMTHWYVWRDSHIRVTWLTHTCDMTHSCEMPPMELPSSKTAVRVPWLMHKQSFRLEYVSWHDSSCVPLVCAETHVYVSLYDMTLMNVCMTWRSALWKTPTWIGLFCTRDSTIHENDLLPCVCVCCSVLLIVAEYCSVFQGVTVCCVVNPYWCSFGFITNCLQVRDISIACETCYICTFDMMYPLAWHDSSIGLIWLTHECGVRLDIWVQQLCIRLDMLATQWC